ncbi:Protein terminal ear1 [Cardamine amara subsp. amara]|uniref:Protein terminal ear1 n=1 Tax=Cardamine amara subsp. amara TaxID=228776 RepID=A0ABD1A5Q0_CARAN
MSVTGPISHPKNLNPTAPEFLPSTNPNPFPFLIPTRIYLPLPPPPPPPPPPYLSFCPLPPISMIPTRAVVLLQVPPNVTESSLKRDMERFGEVRGIQMERADEGIVTVHFYNLKHSQRAVNEIHDLHMQQQQEHFTTATTRGLISGRLVWAQFVFPNLKAVREGNNQGSLVILNLEPTVSSTTLRHIFQLYGEVKELRGTPSKREQRFVEFFDVRDAARALREMNDKVIAGKPILVQFSRPGGFTKKLFLASRYNKSFLFNHHPHSPPSLPRHHLRPPSQLMMKPDNQQLKYNNNYRKKPKRQMRQMQQMKKNRVDDRFIINEDAIATTGEFRDDRTTVMIKNIPNKYNQKLFLNMLDTHCNDSNQKIINQGNNMVMSSYDFVYLPIDFSNKCNVGYGFVNMTSPEAVLRLYKALHNQRWEIFNTRKICEVTYARLQGLESLKEHFKNLRIPGKEMEEYKPVFFSPPRDGELLPEPISVVDVVAKPVSDGDDSCYSRDGTVSDKKMERSDGCCLGERIENGGV